MIDEKDMRILVTRETLEELCKDLFDRVVLPAQRALEASGLTIDTIEQVNIIQFNLFKIIICFCYCRR